MPQSTPDVVDERLRQRSSFVVGAKRLTPPSVDMGAVAGAAALIGEAFLGEREGALDEAVEGAAVVAVEETAMPWKSTTSL